jgi:dolichol-phosphate mannosyltransferase
MKRACIVLPTYNEAQNVRVLLPQIFEATRDVRSHEVHVLVMDDASPDGTQDVVRSFMASQPRLHLLTGQKQGLGVAYQRGFEHALRHLDADLVLQMDADLQHPPQLLPLFLSLADQGFDVVIGSRLAPGGATPRFAWYRRLMSRAGNTLIRVAGGLPPLHDCTSGFRCLRADVLRRCDFSFLSTRGYAFQTSLLSELLRNGARPIEVPMVFGERTYGASKLTLRDQLEFLANLLKVRFRRLLAWARRAAEALRGRRRPAPAPAAALPRAGVARRSAAPRPAAPMPPAVASPLGAEGVRG